MENKSRVIESACFGFLISSMTDILKTAPGRPCMPNFCLQTSKFVMEICLKVTNSLFHDQNIYLVGSNVHLRQKEAELGNSNFGFS